MWKQWVTSIIVSTFLSVVPVAIGDETAPMYIEDQPAVLPHFVGYHDYETMTESIMELDASYPQLIDVFSIGQSVEGREIWCVRVTNEEEAGPKLECLIDAGIHANELEGEESALYLVYYLTMNFGRNATVQRILNKNEVYVIPCLNPDGRVAMTRENANNVNLNRNFDVDWGNPLGVSQHFIPLPGTEYCGPSPFSEPESRALRDFMASHDLAFYLSFHTNAHGFITPWSCFDAPFEIPEEHNAVFGEVLSWVRENTEFGAGHAQWLDFSAGLPYCASGSSMDWCYYKHGVASFTLETSSMLADMLGILEMIGSLIGYTFPAFTLDYWVQASLPVMIYLLANSENLKNWKSPTESIELPPSPAIQPSLWYQTEYVNP
jgi:hypothetical protein